jgi:large conductance mechanosensitive channel
LAVFLLVKAINAARREQPPPPPAPPRAEVLLGEIRDLLRAQTQK